jgi:hypothetical protein
MVAVAGGVGLPDLDEGIGYQMSGTIRHRAVHDDALPFRVIGDERDAAGRRYEDREERPDRLRRREWKHRDLVFL